MSWTSATLRDNFQTIIKSIQAFRKTLNKQPKYDQYFKNIEDAGLAIVEIFYQEQLPPSADQFISSASGGIKTALRAISEAKEGLQDAVEFRDKIFEIYEYVDRFSTNGGSEAKQKEELQKIKKKQKEEDIQLGGMEDFQLVDMESLKEDQKSKALKEQIKREEQKLEKLKEQLKYEEQKNKEEITEEEPKAIETRVC